VVRARTVLRGWALAEQGQSEEGISQMRQGQATCQAVGAEIFHSYFLVLLAERMGKRGSRGRTGGTRRALTVVDKTGERFYEAELYRLRGELTLAQSSVQRLESSVTSPNL